LALQPLLPEQRVSVFRLLSVLISHFAEWSFKSNPSLLPYITNRTDALDRDAITWKFQMVQDAHANRETAGFTPEQKEALVKYLKEGAYYKDTESIPISETKAE
jgi:hypothetical protein